MRELQIHIPPFTFISIRSLKMERGVNAHGKAIVSGHIKTDQEEPYTKMLLEDVWASVVAEDEDGTKHTLLTGIVTDFLVENVAHQSFLTLTIMSGTYLMDQKVHFRSFQNAAITHADVMEIITTGYEKQGVISSVNTAVPLGDFILQYNETDWGFAKRIASRLNYVLAPCFDQEGVKYYFDPQERDTHTILDSTRFAVKKHMDAFLEKTANGVAGLAEADCLAFTIRRREIYQLLDKIVFQGIPLYISNIITEFDGQELMHTYEICTMKAMSIIRQYNAQQSGCSFEATVTAVQKDIVQVSLAGDENASQSVTKWFKYSTVYSSPDGTGWYCMPEVGDTVRLHIPTKREEEGYVISSVHVDNAANRQDPDRKSLKTKYGKEVFFTLDSIVFTNHNGLRMEMLDNEGINIISDKKINIESVDTLTIASEEASIMVAGSKDVILKQNNTSIQLDDDITFTGGQFRIQ